MDILEHYRNMPKPTMPYGGEVEGVAWMKYPNQQDQALGYTTITVNGEPRYFHGRLSNARAWNFITEAIAQGAQVRDGQIITEDAI